MGDLAELRRDLSTLLDNLEPVQHEVGGFAKETALDIAARDLGGDRAFSGLARRVPLKAGYDTGTPVVLHLRPAGLWVLADKGRRRTTRIVPKRRRAAKSPPRPNAVRTPRGWRSYSTSRPSRGHRTIDRVERAIEQGVEQAALRGINRVIDERF